MLWNNFLFFLEIDEYGYNRKFKILVSSYIFILNDIKYVIEIKLIIVFF